MCLDSGVGAGGCQTLERVGESGEGSCSPGLGRDAPAGNEMIMDITINYTQ